MIESLRNWLYRLMTRSGIVLRLIPIIFRYSPALIFGDKNGVNYKVADENGATISLTKYNGKLYPPFGIKRIQAVSNLHIRNDDVILCGYPKSGCHWVYEIMHMMLSRRIELTQHGKEIGGMMEATAPIVLDSLPSPRVLNSHMLYEDLPRQTRERGNKIVLTTRCPKDTLVSYYHHVKDLPHVYHYDGSLAGFFKLFVAGKLEYGSYFDYILSWDNVVKTQVDNPILVVEYEMLKKSPVQVVKTMAVFLDVDISDDTIEKILQSCEFHRMKYERRDNLAGALFRKGTVGDWHNWLTEAQSSLIDQMWEERMSHCFYQPALY